jgi:hypothetical protein
LSLIVYEWRKLWGQMEAARIDAFATISESCRQDRT